MKDFGKLMIMAILLGVGICIFFISISDSEGTTSNVGDSNSNSQTNVDECKNNDDYNTGYEFGQSVIGNPTVRDPETFIEVSGYNIKVTECLKRGFYDGFYQKRSINN